MLWLGGAKHCHDIHVGGGGGAAAKGEGEVQQARPSIRVSKCQMF